MKSVPSPTKHVLCEAFTRTDTVGPTTLEGKSRQHDQVRCEVSLALLTSELVVCATYMLVRINVYMRCVRRSFLSLSQDSTSGNGHIPLLRNQTRLEERFVRRETYSQI
jgi:hypothetical protein